MGAVITLTTDFGFSDAYVAAMKGVILGINPEASIIDICHTIEPGDISRVAFVLSTAYTYFPKDTVHLVVVDPGVGTDRRAVILRTPHASFIAPDNGVLTYVIRSYVTTPPDSRRVYIEPGSEIEAVAITESKFWLSPVSSTFHGRDIFAPIAAHLSLGVPLDDFGQAIDTLTVLPSTEPRTEPDGTITGSIIHIDTFGNLITNIKSSDLPESEIIIEVRSEKIVGLSRTYGSGHDLIALIGSSGYLEIALAGGSAQDLLRASTGDAVKIIRSG